MQPITRRGLTARLAAVLSTRLPGSVRAQGSVARNAATQPITIGFAEALTGGLAAV
jgi:hypothetical protein